MAFLKFRGSTTEPGVWASSVASNAALTNLDIDKNFKSLDSQKLENSGYTQGTVVYGNASGVLTALNPGSNGTVLKLVSGIPSWQSDINTTYNTSAVTTTGGAFLRLNGSDATTDDVKFASGTNVTVAYTDNNTITINSSYTDTTYSQSAVTTTGGALLRLSGTNATTDDVKFASGANVTVAYTDDNTITINSSYTDTNTTYSQSAVTTTGGALLRLSGSDASNDDIKIASGTNVTVAYTDANTITINSSYTDTNTTYSQSAVTTTGGALLRLTGSDSTTDDVKFASGSNVTVAYTDANTITINSSFTDTNTTYSQSAVTTTGGALLRLSGSDSTTDDVKFASGTNITVAYTDANTITISGASAITVTDDTTTNSTHYPLLTTATSGTLSSNKVSSTKLQFNPSTGELAATNLNSLSDARFKKDLEQIQGALGKVKQLTGYTYTLIEENIRSSGLVAQDVEQVLPEAVSGTDERKTLSYGNMMGLIVEAIKELDSKLENIQNQLSNK